MAHPSQQEVVRQIERLEEFLNEWRMIPATSTSRNKVFLSLLSKALTTGRAVCVLVQAGFPAEAFGLSRTLIEIFFSVRYMSKDTNVRVRTYVEYLARVQKEWVAINAKYFPNRPLELPVHVKEIAEKFPQRSQWTAHGGGARFMALEKDAFETDESGEPITGAFDYDTMYFWTSQYVHATCHAVAAHIGELGEVFRVRAKFSNEADLGRLALFNVLTSLTKTFIQACRAMREEQPEEILQDIFAMLPQFERDPQTQAKSSAKLVQRSRAIL